MRRFAILLVLSVALGGCAKLQAAVNYATSATVSPVGVYIAANTFNGLEVSAKNYLLLPSCAKNPQPCRSPAITPPIIDWVQKGRAARNNLEAFLDSHPGQLGLQGDYDALNAAIGSLQTIFAQNNIAVVK